MSHETELMDVISEKFEDLVIPSLLVEVSPVEADIIRTFVENAPNEENEYSKGINVMT
ncbi:hypothetical protein [Legionella anisa]|uniref:hypothetical protein n=1 Tax=Legionella anisa TaxID=28082 RepID=UPI00034D836F|nr:hypothetical protein [Legionella anisa]